MVVKPKEPERVLLKRLQVLLPQRRSLLLLNNLRKLQIRILLPRKGLLEPVLERSRLL